MWWIHHTRGQKEWMMEEVNSVSLWYKAGGFSWSACSVAQSCLTLWGPLECSPPGSSVHKIFFLGKNTGVCCHFLLQGIFQTQESKLHLLCLLHCRWILLTTEPSGKPWVDLDTVERKESWLPTRVKEPENFVILFNLCDSQCFFWWIPRPFPCCR